LPQGPQSRNELSGNVDGPVVQAQEIHGGITFHVHSAAPDDPLPRPDQVPPLTVRCVNHTEELSFLDSSLADATRGSLDIGFGVVSGMPGVGKTTLVCRWADTVRDQFPDGQLFVDYAAERRKTGGAVSAAVTACLKSLGVRDAFLPKSLENLTTLFRTHSAGRRILVVLDDVDQPAQVLPLVPKGPGSMLLVTSNSRLGELSLDGARPLYLGPLDMDSGLRLLAQRCGEEAVEAERDAAERLVVFCAGLPKALQLVAARFLTSKRLTMSRLAEELADESRRLRGLSLRGEHSVAAALELVYRALPPDAARLYQALGWIPGRTFDAGTAAVAAHLDTAQTEALLDVLEEASLVDVTEDGRFRLHDLVRLHARERASGTAEQDAEVSQLAVVERVATHYLALTAFADRSIREDRLRIGDLEGLLRGAPNPFATDGGPDPLAWLEAECANILAVLRDASRLGLHMCVWQLAEGFTVLFLHRRYLEEWTESLELAVTAAAKAVVPAAEGRLRSLLSRPLMDLEQYERARAELEKAVACAEVSGHTALQASVQEFFGRYWDHFDPARAVKAYQQSVELNIEAEEWRGVAIATYFLGCAQDAAGHHEQALDTLRRAHQDLLARNDKRMAARALAAIGAVHDHLGDPDTAMRVLGEAADALRERKASHYEAQALVLLADITERTGGAPETVREHLRQAYEIHKTGGSLEAAKLRERLDLLGGTG
jgi:tetratricopeptide (TPR) repeat protein